MSFFDNLVSKAKESLQAVASGERGVPLPEALINSQLQKLCADSSSFQEIHVQLLDGLINVAATVQSKQGTVKVSASMEIVKFVIDNQQQVIEFRLIDEPKIEPNGWILKVVTSVMSVILKVLFGRTLIEWGVSDVEGISVNGSIITIDLEKLGAADLIKTAIKSKLGVMGDLLSVIPTNTVAIEEHISVVRAVATVGALTVHFQYSA